MLSHESHLMWAKLCQWKTRNKTLAADTWCGCWRLRIWNNGVAWTSEWLRFCQKIIPERDLVQYPKKLVFRWPLLPLFAWDLRISPFSTRHLQNKLRLQKCLKEIVQQTDSAVGFATLWASLRRTSQPRAGSDRLGLVQEILHPALVNVESPESWMNITNIYIYNIYIIYGASGIQR